MKALQKRDKLKSFIVPKITDPSKFLDNKGNLSIYTGGNIHGLYCYLEMIVDPPTLTTSGQGSHHFGPSYSTNNDKETIQPVIACLCFQQKLICECCK